MDTIYIGIVVGLYVVTRLIVTAVSRLGGLE